MTTTLVTNSAGSIARVFSSWDASTTDLHFRWMQQYGIVGVFLQRFFGVTRSEASRRKNRVILENALTASRKYGPAIAVMYDLSGLRASGEDCSSIMQDYRELVDILKLTSQGINQIYARRGALLEQITESRSPRAKRRKEMSVPPP